MPASRSSSKRVLSISTRLARSLRRSEGCSRSRLPVYRCRSSRSSRTWGGCQVEVDGHCAPNNFFEVFGVPRIRVEETEIVGLYIKVIHGKGLGNLADGGDFGAGWAAYARTKGKGMTLSRNPIVSIQVSLRCTPNTSAAPLWAGFKRGPQSTLMAHNRRHEVGHSRSAVFGPTKTPEKSDHSWQTNR